MKNVIETPEPRLIFIFKQMSSNNCYKFISNIMKLFEEI